MANDVDTRSEPYAGLSVLDEKGASVGFISDVLFDNGGSDPSWFVVDCGWLRAEHYVPADGSYVTSKGQLIIPFQKRWVRAAPKAAEGHVLTSALRRQLSIHYG